MNVRWFLAACVFARIWSHVCAAENAPSAPTPNASASAPAAPPAAMPTDESLSRQLLQLKSSRAEAAAHLPAGDPQVAEVDRQILAMRQQIAERLNADAGPPSASIRIAALAPVFPRIAEPASDNPAQALPEEPDDTQDDANKPDYEALDFRAPANVIARSALARRISLHAKQQPFSAVLESIGAQTGDSIAVNWPAMQSAGIDRNASVTVDLTAVAANRALQEVLAIVGADTVRLHYILDGGVVTVSTPDDLVSQKYQMVRVYDIRDMIDFDSTQYPFELEQSLLQNRIDNLIDTVKSAVEPDTWRDNGGTVGSIEVRNGKLIVNQTGENQEAVLRLLAQLRGQR